MRPRWTKQLKKGDCIYRIIPKQSGFKYNIHIATFVIQDPDKTDYTNAYPSESAALQSLSNGLNKITLKGSKVFPLLKVRKILNSILINTVIFSVGFLIFKMFIS